LRNGAWLVSNLCRGQPRVDLKRLDKVLPVLALLLRSSGDEETLTDALWAVSYLSDGEQENIDVVLATNRPHDDDAEGCEGKDQNAEGGAEGGAKAAGDLVRSLVALLDHPTPKVSAPALRCVGNLVTGDDASTDAVVTAPGFLPALKRLLLASPRYPTRRRSAAAAARKEVCWTLSNITAGTSDQIQKVLDAGLLDPLLALAALDESAGEAAAEAHGGARAAEGQAEGQAEVQKEAVWAVANAASGASKRQVRALVKAGAVRALCKAIENSAADPRTHAVAADGLGHMLRKAGGDPHKASGGPPSPLSPGTPDDSPGRKGLGAGGLVGGLAKGTPAYKWRRRVLKAMREAGGEAALKKMARAPTSGLKARGPRAGRGTGRAKKAAEAKAEAATKASALLALMALTKEILSRAKHEAKSKGKAAAATAQARRRRARRERRGGEAKGSEEGSGSEEGDFSDFSDESDGGHETGAVAPGLLLEDLLDEWAGPSAPPPDHPGIPTWAKSGARQLEEQIGLDQWGGGGLDEWGDDDPSGGGSGVGGDVSAKTITIVARSPEKSSPGGGSPDSGSRNKIQVRRGWGGSGASGAHGGVDLGREAPVVGSRGETQRIMEAMEHLERELGIVSIDPALGGGSRGEPKRGWTDAWGVGEKVRGAL